MNEIVFRLLMLSLIIAVVWIRLYFIFQNEKAILGSDKSREVEPKAKSSITNILVIISRGLILAYIIAPSLISFFGLGINGKIRLGAAALAALLLCMQIWVHRTLGLSFDFRLITRDAQKLVTGGPYKWVRNPMYSVNIMTEICFGILSSNLLVLVFGFLTGALILGRAYGEERMLLQNFGQEYERYRNSTKRFIPFIY